jgi:signal-transduction protein with cAMP-binding, CBS, and nucleotidyltransferase domain
MPDHIRSPEEILAYRPLRRILDQRPRALWSVGPNDNVRTAMSVMAERDIGFLVVLDAGNMVGVLSERDCARRVVLDNRSADTTKVADVMTRQVVTVDLAHAFADCLRLMHQHAIRHLPVIENGKPIAVISIRDLLSEAVAHHARIIANLELERLSIFSSTV